MLHNADYVNDYGEKELASKAATSVIDNGFAKWLLCGNPRNWIMKSAGVISQKMLSEVILHLVS
jgi:hypothetical protein